MTRSCVGARGRPNTRRTCCRSRATFASHAPPRWRRCVWRAARSSRTGCSRFSTSVATADGVAPSRGSGVAHRHADRDSRSAFVPSRALGNLPVIVSGSSPSEAVVAEQKRAGRARAARSAQSWSRFTASDLLGQPTQCDYGKKGTPASRETVMMTRRLARAHLGAIATSRSARSASALRERLSDVERVPPGVSFPSRRAMRSPHAGSRFAPTTVAA